MFGFHCLPLGLIKLIQHQHDYDLHADNIIMSLIIDEKISGMNEMTVFKWNYNFVKYGSHENQDLLIPTINVLWASCTVTVHIANKQKIM